MQANENKNKDTKRENRRLRFRLFKMKGRIFYMKYAKIVILALIEIISELFYSYKKSGRR